MKTRRSRIFKLSAVVVTLLTGPSAGASTRAAAAPLEKVPGGTLFFSACAEGLEPDRYDELCRGESPPPELIGTPPPPPEVTRPEIHSTSRASLEPIRVTDNDIHETDLLWSPDGDFVALSARTPNVCHLYVMKISTGRLKNIVKPDDGPCVTATGWSPDSRRLAFVIDYIEEYDGPGAGYTIRRNGTELRYATRDVVYEGHNAFDMQWLNMKRLTYWRERSWQPNAMLSMNLKGRNRHHVPTSPYMRDMVLTPNKDKVAYSGSKSYSGKYDVFLMAPDGTGSRRLTNSPTNEHNLTWSPDGSKLALVASRQHRKDQVLVLKPRTKKIKRVRIPDDVSLEESPTLAWSPSGKYVAFDAQNEDDEFAVFVGRPGRRTVRVTPFAHRLRLLGWRR